MRGGSRREIGMRRRAAIGLIAVAALTLGGCRVGEAKVRRRINVTTDAKGTAQFTPRELTVQKGDEVTIVVVNHTNKVHGFSIRGYGVPPSEVAPDKPDNVVFKAKKEGTYEIFCQLHPTHKRAALIVE